MNDLQQWLKERDIQDVECLVPDMTGIARGKFLPVDQFMQDTIHIAEGMLLTTVNGDYCEQVSELVHPNDKDMILEADFSTLRVSPWAKKPTAQVIHRCITKQGSPHLLSTRDILIAVLERFEQQGWKPIIAPEVEFYLTVKSSDPQKPIQTPLGKSESSSAVSQPLSLDSYYEFESFYAKLRDYCQLQNLDIGVICQEMGSGQIEINFRHGEALAMADQVFTLKRTIRHVADEFSLQATFMAKPIADQPGSSMHIHQSVLATESGENVFSNEDGSRSQLFHHYIGGLQKYTPKLMSIYAPNVNSYRRFTRYMSAPIAMHWGVENRTIAFRVPDAGRAAMRVENRFAGMDCNPYLAIAASLASGLAGINNKLEPTAPYEGNASDESVQIVKTLDSALEELKTMDDFGDLINAEFLNAYRLTKLTELDAFNRVVTAWEREYLKHMV